MTSFNKLLTEFNKHHQQKDTVSSTTLVPQLIKKINKFRIEEQRARITFVNRKYNNSNDKSTNDSEEELLSDETKIKKCPLLTQLGIPRRCHQYNIKENSNNIQLHK